MHRIQRWATIALVALFLAGCAGTDPDGAAERSVEELYADARSSLSSGNYSQAVERFENLVARYPFGDHAVQSQLMIIYAHYLAGQHESAIAAAERFQRMHPRNEHVAYALYMSGVARQAQGPGGLGDLFNVDPNLRDPEPKRRAFADFRDLTEQYPDSEYIDDATERMEQIRTALAEHELHVGRFYLERGAYIAAANRARTIIARYPGTPAVGEAMGMLAEAYRSLGLDPLDEDVERERRERHEVPAPEFGGR
ncbi:MULTISPECIES: outer membrane protein assembly factor BamD [Halorhodospira]|uniref:outer membrane protein assembly factor BamD n=1 Tax=Halorhodospira TaxID=85108 RepID=UPI0019127E5E|nr:MULTISPECIES: outer membrane protein assembly factor BamD [Halorhodospira]MBK5936616.1 outer membrane protein assembly factor BamD [Halorhodospira halophila]MBK5944545.1 outer membrane protein assembly factor BamD [Halorhodospira halophila]MCG5527309.1 outer membrane protein assembly factor BamD [Halorhodospira halophila]MCG5538864.1 outer membrane protein assembly factor BamD [Halorhodospira sp. 9622]MCG5541368.1 outer membrane protein assembly factor BamD [Halorhodospira sp. M39old]